MVTLNPRKSKEKKKATLLPNKEKGGKSNVIALKINK